MFGAHVIIYSVDATADRAFFRDVLGLASVDADSGWLIFALHRQNWPFTQPKRAWGTSFT